MWQYIKYLKDLWGWKYQTVLILTNILRWREISQCSLLHLCSLLHIKNHQWILQFIASFFWKLSINLRLLLTNGILESKYGTKRRTALWCHSFLHESDMDSTSSQDSVGISQNWNDQTQTYSYITGKWVLIPNVGESLFRNH
jgi:hypothetical protein